jgi:hypothetical protein
MEGNAMRTLSRYWLLPPEARAHIDRICAPMRAKPKGEEPTELPIQLTAEDIADAERLLKWKGKKEGVP